jgi:transcriptional regulator with XRE-family HTH domain
MMRQAENEETFAAALRRLRRAKGLTQRELATLLGHSQRSLQNLEAGAYAPGARAWVRLREILGQDLPVP